SLGQVRCGKQIGDIDNRHHRVGWHEGLGYVERRRNTLPGLVISGQAIIEDAIACADGGVVQAERPPGDTQTRSEVILVGGVQSARDSVLPCELLGSSSVVELGDMVVLLDKWRLHFVAQPEVQSQSLRYLEVVIYVQGVVPAPAVGG